MLLAEVAQQHAPPAVGGFGVEAHALQPGRGQLAAALRRGRPPSRRPSPASRSGPAQQAVLVGDDGARLLEQVQRGRGADPRQPARPHDVGQGARPLADRVERGAQAVRLRPSRGQEPLHGHVAGVVVQLDDRGLAVPPRPADLLVVVVERAGRGGVQHEPHVGLVDAHAEGRGGHDDAGRARGEPVVHRFAPGPTEARVVGLRRDPAAAQRLGQAARLGARGAVDQAPAAGSPRPARPRGRPPRRAAAPRRCAAPPPGAGSGGRTTRSPRRGRRSPSRSSMSARTGGAAVAVNASDRRVAQLRDHRTEAQVVRTEVVAPLRHAVRLVDRRTARCRDLRSRSTTSARASCSGARKTYAAPPSSTTSQASPGLLGALHRVDHYCVRRALRRPPARRCGCAGRAAAPPAARRRAWAGPAAPRAPGRSPTCPRRSAAPPARPARPRRPPSPAAARGAARASRTSRPRPAADPASCRHAHRDHLPSRAPPSRTPHRRGRELGG